jgi:hypothetical protein
MRLKPEIKEMWLKALRSGEYTQGQGHLHRIDETPSEEVHTFCCLGVLCDLAVKNGVAVQTTKLLRHDGATEFKVEVYGGRPTMPPTSVVQWAFDTAFLARHPNSYEQYNVPVLNPTYDDGMNQTLESLNDQGYSFEAIADLIEKHM